MQSSFLAYDTNLYAESELGTTLVMTSTWVTCLVAAAVASAEVVVFPSTPRFSPSYSASQGDSAEAVSEVAAVSLEAVSLKDSPAVVAVEHVDSQVALEANKASTLVDKGPRTTMAPAAHQPTPQMMMTTMSKQNRDEGEEAVEMKKRSTAKTTAARTRHRGGALRRRRLRLRVTSNCSSSARSAWSFWQPSSSSPRRPLNCWCWCSAQRMG